MDKNITQTTLKDENPASNVNHRLITLLARDFGTYVISLLVTLMPMI